MLLLTFPTFGARSPLQPAPSVTLRHIYSTLLNPPGPITSEQQARAKTLLEVAKLNRLVFQQALAGDPNCGHFLAELLAFISKNQVLLRRKNEGFRRFNADWKRARARQ